MRRTRLWISVALAAAMLALLIWQLGASAQPFGVVSGVVIDAHGPIEGAVVRQQTTTNHTTSTAGGGFALGGLPEGVTTTVTAWSEGYYPGGVQVMPLAEWGDYLSPSPPHGR